jgi:NADPH:quinone reductase-like Zn-dependent oxidoreductase
MQAMYLVRTGDAAQAFELRDAPTPEPAAGQVRIAVDAFGLNYADVSARQGLYQDAPPMPSVIGYEVVGRVDALGPGVENLAPGQRVTALTRFGGYATHAVTDARAVAAIAEDMDVGVAAAYYRAEEMVRLHAGDHVLVHAAAGGVGTLLVQLCKRRGCVVYGTVGSDDKLPLLRDLGVDHPINYRSSDFAAEVRRLRGAEGLDVIFDSIGGKTTRQGMTLLGAGGRMVGFGAADHTPGPLQPLRSLRFALSFGLPHPVLLLMRSRAFIGVNMLRIADQRPFVLQRCLQAMVDLARRGELRAIVGGRFPVTQLGAAHALLESRRSTGKIVVTWDR